MHKIVVLDGYTLNPGDLSWNALEAFGDLRIFDRTNDSDIVERIADSNIVLTNKTPITRNIMDACPSIEYIGVLATGYNVVDCETAKEKGIVVTNIPTYGTAAVSQFAIALLLEICHHIGFHSQTVTDGHWSQCSDFCYWRYPLIELSGKTMGIIGVGRIGVSTAKIAQSLGMKTIGYDSAINPDLVNEGIEFVSLNDLLANSDVISLHCPLFPSTQGIINAENINKMKDGVIIINTARGPLVVEEDLAEALNSGKVYAAGLDVVSKEPISENNPLLTAKNCIITPHIAWAPKESRQRLMDIATRNVQQFLNGAPINVVNI